MKSSWFVSFMIAGLLFFSFAPMLHGGLAAVGPVDPNNGFPAWYQDGNGLALKLGLEGDGVTGLSLFDPVDPTNPFSVQIGFGAEAFYWIGEASMDVPGGLALLVLALEAAFLNEDPADGDQIVFARVRIRISMTTPGDYTVTHPFGVEEFEAVPVGIRAINFTRDVGIGLGAAGFDGALAGDIGPFLEAVSPAPPGGHVGNPQVDQTVTGRVD